MGRKPPTGENWSNNCVVYHHCWGVRSPAQEYVHHLVTDYPIINNTQQRMRIRFLALRERDKMTIEYGERVVWVQRILNTTNSNTPKQQNRCRRVSSRSMGWGHTWDAES